MAYSNYADQQIRQRHHQIVLDANAKGEIKRISWNEFWQIYNRLMNAQQYDSALLHLRLSWNPRWNEGKDIFHVGDSPGNYGEGEG